MWNLSAARWSNGSSDVAWPNSSSIAIFGNNHGAAGTVTVTQPVSVSGLTFNPASSGNYNLAGPAAVNLGPANFGTVTVAVNGSATPTISAPLTAINANVDFTGTGTMTLSGTNTFTGGITLVGGTLNASSPSALGAGGQSSNDLNIGSGATLNILSNVTVTGHGPGNQDTNNGKLSIPAGDSLTLAGTTDGSYLFTQSGGTLTNNGTLTAPVAFNYTGGTLVNSGTISCQSFYDSAGPVSGLVTVGAAGINTAFSGTFDVTGYINNTTPIGSTNGQIASGAVVNFMASGSGDVAAVTAAGNAGKLTFTSAPGTALSLNLPSGFVNSGSITLAADGTPSSPASVLAGFNNAAGGIFAVNTPAQVSGSVLNTGTVSVAAGEALSVSSGTFNQAGGTLSGTLNISSGTFVDAGGTVTGTVGLSGTSAAVFGPNGAGVSVLFTGPNVSGSINSSSGANVPAGAVIAAQSVTGATNLIVYNNANYGGISVVSANGSNANLNLAGYGGFTNFGTLTIAAAGQPSFPANLSYAMFTNATGAKLNINTSASVGYGSEFMVNSGQFTVGYGAVAQIGQLDQTGGQLTVIGSVDVQYDFYDAGGTISLTANAASPGTLGLTNLTWPSTAAATSLSISTSTTTPASEGRIDLLGTAAANFSLYNPAGTLNISANITDGGLLKSGPGTLLLTGNSTYTGATNVSAGTLVLAAGATLATTAITVSEAATFNMSGSAPAANLTAYYGADIRFPAANGSTPAVVQLGSLNTTSNTVVVSPAATHAGRTLLVLGTLTLDGQVGQWTSQLDLTSNDMDVTGGSLATITDQIRNGYDIAYGGNWSGYGITSSTARYYTRHLTAVGVMQNSQGGSAIYSAANKFDGYSPAAGDVLVKYTWFGDANLDGKVDGSDYSLIDAGYASHGGLTGWYHGDFNYDGVIDGSDYSLIDNAYNNQTANLAYSAQAATSTALLRTEPAAVPEPEAASLPAVVIAALALRRRRGRPVVRQ